MTAIAEYSRYSNEKQNPLSIEDQFRLIRQRAAREGWRIVGSYSDAAMSGASMARPGIRDLIRDAQAGKFSIILCEGLDRLSRDQADVAAFYNRMKFLGITIVTLADGEITPIHIGMKGTMNALFLVDLADKTRRGLRGRVENCKSGGGKAFGYDVVKRLTPDGEHIRGERAINEVEAAIVRQIFADYLNGISPRSIASTLNARGVKAPGLPRKSTARDSGKWGASTIYGNRERGTGILNNELYVGKLVWNRLRYMKDPDTGLRISRVNAEDDVVRKDVPELRIIDQDTWDRVKALQGKYNKREMPLWTKNRPKGLLSGLTKCGCCGGGFTTMSGGRIGCASSRNKGTCDNRRTIKMSELEQSVIGALQHHLMDEALCAEFCKAYTTRINELRIERNATLAGNRAALAKLEREREQIIRSIQEGVPGSLLKDRAVVVQNRLEELQAILATSKEAPVYFHPRMADRYHAEIKNLIAALNDPAARAEASKILRSLIARILLTPRQGDNGLVVDLIGDLAGILTIATQRGNSVITAELSKLNQVNGTDYGAALSTIANDSDGAKNSAAQEADVLGNSWAALAMVAGAGFEPTTFRL